MNLVQKIIIAGGVIHGKGNDITSTQEFNFYSDPEAVKIVFNTPVKKIVLPLDLRKTVHLVWQDVLTVKNSIVRSILDHMLSPFIQKYPDPTAVLFDPFAIFYAEYPHQPTYFCRVSIEDHMSTIHYTPVPSSNDHHNCIEVVKEIPSNDFKKFLKDTLM